MLLVPALAFASPAAGPQATLDVEEVCDGPSWDLRLFTTVGGTPDLDELGIFREAIGKCLHPLYGRIIVYWYDSIYNCVGLDTCEIDEPPGVGDRQVRLCHDEHVAPKFRNCDPPVRVLSPRLP